MSFFKEQELQFIERTKSLLEQYDKLEVVPNQEEKYEVTLLLNCCVGLLILPQSKWHVRIPQEEISSLQWGIDPSKISICKSKSLVDEPKNLQNVTRHLRNSIAHHNFTILKNENEEIGSIEFKDFPPRTKSTKTFELTIEIKPLKKFLLKFSEEMIRIMEAAKR